MRLGVYGGSFDPIHIGHLLLADTIRDELRLDRVDFVPLGVPPHLKNVRTSGEDRVAMARAALSGRSGFNVCRFEVDSPKTSYTADTLAYYRKLYPTAELYLILSSETFNDLPNWRDPSIICSLASIAIARRAGYPEPNFEALRPFVSELRLAEFRRQVVSAPLIELSSSDLRERLATGRSVQFRIPDAALDYIKEHSLYSRRDV